MKKTATVIAFLSLVVGGSMRAVPHTSPVLSINSTTFTTCSHNWAISVTGAAANTAVELTEFHEYDTPTGYMEVDWGPSTIGSTNGSGSFSMTSDAPSFTGSFVSRVKIGSDYSNPIYYGVVGCSPTTAASTQPTNSVPPGR